MKLKPCPFCGGSDLECRTTETNLEGDVWEVWCDNPDCGRNYQLFSEHEAVEAWNMRCGREIRPFPIREIKNDYLRRGVMILMFIPLLILVSLLNLIRNFKHLVKSLKSNWRMK